MWEPLKKIDNYTPVAYNEYIWSRVIVHNNNKSFQDIVTKQIRDQDKRPVEQQHNNLILDTRQYKMIESDKYPLEIHINNIVINLYSQINNKGKQYFILIKISDHMTDRSEIKTEDIFYISQDRNKISKKW